MLSQFDIFSVSCKIAGIKQLLCDDYQPLDNKQVLFAGHIQTVNARGKLILNLSNRYELCPQEVLSFILQNLRKDIIRKVGADIPNVLVSIPSVCTSYQRSETRKAAETANFKVLELLNETTAVALEYGRRIQTSTPKRILVFSIGAGTTGVSLVEVNNASFKVLATGGDCHLGGWNFDENLINHVSAKLSHLFGPGILNDQRSFQRLRKATRKAKEILSEGPVAKLQVLDIKDGKDFECTITRDQ